MKAKLKQLMYKSEVLSLALIILICVAFSIANPVFFNIINILDLLKVCSYPTIFACGVMIVLISGGLDMSFMWIGMFCLLPMLVPALKDCRFRFPLPLFVWVGSWLFFASSFAPTFYGLGGDGPYRVQNMRYVLFVLLFALSVGYTAGWFLRVIRERRGEWDVRLHASAAWLERRFGLLLLIGVMGVGMMLSVLLRHDSAAVTLSAMNTLLNGEAKIWHAENLERERILAESGPEVGIPAHSVIPMLLQTKDYSPNPDVEPNTFIAPYYGKEKIWLVE